MVSEVLSTLADSYGLQPVEITPIPVGPKVYYRITDTSDHSWFVKAYWDRTVPRQEHASIELAEFARAGQVPVPAVRRTRDGKLLADTARAPMSVWQYVTDTETADGRITGPRWQTVGAVVGRLHRHLATHPAAAPTLRPATEVRDIEQSRREFDRLITAYNNRRTLDTYEEWAVDAIRQGRALLDRFAGILSRLPPLTVQITHSDLASPNILLRGNEVAAVIDFWPPAPRYLSWEIARIACDPKTILAGDQWITGLPELLAGYRQENPTARPDDLMSAVAVGCVWTLASTYTLAEPIDRPHVVNTSLLEYAQPRYRAHLLLLERLDDIQEMLHDQFQ